jgi:hypothetical protein
MQQIELEKVAEGISNPTEQRVILKDGRTLGFAEYGDPKGEPVLEFHGCPGSRLEAWNYDAAGKKLGARVIGIDRPGFGMPTYVKALCRCGYLFGLAALAAAAANPEILPLDFLLSDPAAHSSSCSRGAQIAPAPTNGEELHRLQCSVLRQRPGQPALHSAERCLPGWGGRDAN